jgi:chromatin segregation and condensation protein Rec8/ScpA/Scc1 (kleisin family)
MENATICLERAERDRAQAEDPSTTERMRERLLESAARWEEMAHAAQRFENERQAREDAVKRRNEEPPAPPKPRAKRIRRKPDPDVLVLTKRMIYQPQLEAAA